MPRVSDYQKDLRFVKDMVELNILLQSSCCQHGIDSSENSPENEFMEKDSDSDSDMELLDSSSYSEDDFVLEMYAAMDSTRHYDVGMPISKQSTEFATQYLANMPQGEFRQMTRMDKNSFFTLVGLIEGHDVFLTKSKCQQTPVCLQLAVTLDRLGHDGMGACFKHLNHTWGVCTSSLVTFTARCITALDDGLHGSIKWPDRTERKAICKEFAKKGFPGCVGLIGGTLIPLAQRPTRDDWECYYDRKSRYSVNAQVVCDHMGRILYLSSGMQGSYADITCLKSSSLWEKMDGNQLFGVGQYLLGDSGYENASHLICSFKKTDNAMNKQAFNTCVAECRVTNGHCIGVLKSRWHSLNELRIQLNSTNDDLRLVKWIGLCAKLHNFLIARNDIWSEGKNDRIRLDNDSEEDPVTELAAVESLVQPGAELLKRVMHNALRFHVQPGGCLAGLVLGTQID